MANTDHTLEHAKVSSWFLGPRAENFDILKEFFACILDDQRVARESIYKDDPAFITAEVKATESFTESIATLREDVKNLSKGLATHSIPFWSPRYNAHMNMDTAMSSIIGYMASMMYNPNNVATEASPFTTALEKNVGMQLCGMLGYRTSGDFPGWGHITCDGSVANLEAIWASKSSSPSPTGLPSCSSSGPLRFLADARPPFLVENCQGTKKPFGELSTWELLNLTPSTILDLPTRLATEHSISAAFLQTALNDFLIQTLGKDQLEKKFGIKKSPKFLISTTKHYSWPKGGAIAGLGSDCFIDIQVDDDARMDVADLRRQLDSCIHHKDDEDEHTPVFGCVAIIGSTEHGACDPLAELVRVRSEYEEQGLSFAIHADAAWGGYFASMVPSDGPLLLPNLPYVPTLALQPYTIEQLKALANADSITIDPHKSGYINYPAGGLCYRDARMRYLITWTSPIVYHAGDDTGSMGVYGVEGSKPGASAVATWLTHKTLGLHESGYGRLLGEAVFTCTKLYCYWATLTEPTSDLIVVPLIRLPAEKEGGDQQKIEEQKDYIRKRILGVSNENLIKDKEAVKLLKKLGGDLMINAFACNFKIDGKPNRNVVEANYLNERIFKRLSVTSMDDIVAERPLFLTQSKFGDKKYGSCLRHYKRRLQLNDGRGGAQGDLTFLVNVTMSPWPTDSSFLSELTESFRKIAEEEVERCILRNKITKSIHGFVMQGLEQVFLVHLPMFNMANHRWQLILAADLPAAAKEQYQNLRKDNPEKFYTVANTESEILETMLEPGASVHVRMDEGIPAPDAPPLAEFELTNIRVVVRESMSFDTLDATYPDKMPFYLYGSAGERHVDHVLKTSPNAQLNADCVSVAVQPELTEEQLSKGVVAVFETVFEKAMQPFLDDSRSENPKPIASGEITLGKTVYVDWKEVNMDPASEHH
ncbi:pyridoxal-dependent decarboxylase conserved domain protein [Cryphonectria parasitica EP155]|uniref:Pyridoxal-dependent decarboxylase conserved domain protein n=1 Tax=Cryphonectria parasitica (strain ATCC 38755 / EP155) TaxID=660469 RepID=A0A9P4XWI9_CRYP1|nr:pyridoxal-dependent decarboxylase conserved domain protein [Cryphonectria parasitica EP155]KAF3762117.1 pyridoxal-dependent decarboxylase conserved domain protein [Cryphonectria parasitica EP155]